VNYWHTALSLEACLFPLQNFFFPTPPPVTNYLMLIFIYNFHLSDIIASSGLLSGGGGWWMEERCHNTRINNAGMCSETRAFLFFSFLSLSYHGALMVMNECIFMCTHTHTHTHIHTHTHTHTRMWPHSIIWYSDSVRFSFPANHSLGFSSASPSDPRATRPPRCRFLKWFKGKQPDT